MITTASGHRRRSRLTTGELAEAAVLADLSVALSVIGAFIPALGGLILAAAATPYAALAYRRRPRAVFAAGGVASVLVLLVVGPLGAIQQLVLALLGLIIGGAAKHRWRDTPTIVVAAVTIGAVMASMTYGLLLLFSRTRELLVEQISISGRSISNIVRFFGGDGVGDWVTVAAEAAAQNWYITLPAFAFAFGASLGVAAQFIGEPSMRRLGESLGDPVDATETGAHGDPGPLPVELADVSLRYAGADRDALDQIDLRIEAGQFVGIVGANGSGKSSLLKIIAGADPTSGAVERPGSAGRGQVGGTAQIFQRPESQVLGVHIKDDMIWGLDEARAAQTDIEALLTHVGLSGMADRETATLSGGQLQRLAIAAALAHRPALLLSDEATSMLDRDGRREVSALLAALPVDDDVTVVHVTHRREEVAAADIVYLIEDGRIAAAGPPDVVLDGAFG